MDLSINSGTGYNEGIYTVEFDSGRKFFYTTAAGELSGLTYGERKLLFVGKSIFLFIYSLLLVYRGRALFGTTVQSLLQKQKILRGF